MGIRRAPRPDSYFYILDKRISEDARLSWAARGLLVFLLGKPDDWEVSIAALTKLTPLGRDGVRGLIRELSDAGYVSKGQTKEAGRFGVGVYEVSEQPAISAQKPRASTVSPSPVKPAPVAPSPVNPPLLSTDYNQGLREPRKPPNPRKRGQEPAGVVLPIWLDPKAWADWCEHRRGKRWTPKAMELSIRTLDKLRAAGDSPRAVIEQSIANGWTGLFAVKRDRQGLFAKPDPRGDVWREMQAAYAQDEPPSPFSDYAGPIIDGEAS